MIEMVNVAQPSSIARIGRRKFIRPKPAIISRVESMSEAIEARLASIG